MRRLLPALLTALLVLVTAVPALAAEGISVYLNNQPLAFDVDPFVVNGRTLVPLRGLAEALGFQVGYDPADEAVTLTRGQTLIKLWAGSTRVEVNGQEATLDVPVTVRSGRSFVPVRFISERLGAQVSWDGSRQAVVVTTAGAVPTAPSPAAPSPTGPSPEALALLQKSMEFSRQMSDQKMTGHMEMEITMSGAGMNMSFQMPMEMTLHIHEGNMLMTIDAEMPMLAEEGPLHIESAFKDGTVYTWNPVLERWEITGEYAPGNIYDSFGVLDLEGMEGFTSLFQMEQELFSKADVTVVGSEVVEGVTATRLDISLAADAMNDLLAEVMGTMALPADEVPELSIDRYNYSIWVDPETGFAPRTVVDMVMSMRVEDPALPEAMAVTISAGGEMSATLTSEPITWPDLSGAVPMESDAPQLNQSIQGGE